MTAKGSKKLTSSNVKRYLGAVTALSTMFIYPVFAEASVNTADGLPSIEIFMENFDSLYPAPAKPSLDVVIKQSSPAIRTQIVLPVAETPVKKTAEKKEKNTPKLAHKTNNKPKIKKVPAVATIKKAPLPAVIAVVPEKTNKVKAGDNVKTVAAPVLTPDTKAKDVEVENKVVVLKDITRTLPAPTSNIAKLPAQQAEVMPLPPAALPVPLVIKKEAPAVKDEPVKLVEVPAKPVKAAPAEAVKEIAALPDKTADAIIEKTPTVEDKPVKSSSMFDWLPFGKNKSEPVDAPLPSKEIAKAEPVTEKMIEKEQATLKTELPDTAMAVAKDPLYPEDLALPPVLPDLPPIAASVSKELPPLGVAQPIADKPVKVSDSTLPTPMPVAVSGASSDKTGKEVVLSQPLPLPTPPIRSDKTIPAMTPPGGKNIDDAALTEPYKLASLPKVVAPSPVNTQSEPSGRNQLLSLNFIKNQVSITDAEKKLLHSQLKSLIPTSKRLTIVSYASSTPDQAGSDRRISLQRAIEVRKIIIGQGIDDMRINVQAMGDTSPNGVKDHVDIFSITESSSLQ